MIEVKTRELVKRERQAVIGQMVQGIVHNLRGPVTVVRSRGDIACRVLSELLDAPGDVPGGCWKSIERLVHNQEGLFEAIDRIEFLIDSLLSKGRQEADGEKQDLNLNDIIEQELRFLDADMDMKHGIKKRLCFDLSVPSLPVIYSDFSQIIYNLTKNASDAMKNSENKALAIFTKHDDQNVYLVFQDTGSGISPNDLERVFDPFFSTKPNTLEAYEPDLATHSRPNLLERKKGNRLKLRTHAETLVGTTMV